MIKGIVIAGNVMQYRRWIQEEGRKSSEYPGISAGEQLRAIDGRGLTCHLVGDFTDNPAYVPALIQARGFKLNDENPIQWEGWWEEAEKVQCPEPWETFTLKAWGEEVGDCRNATVEDLRLAGFVPADSVKVLVEALDNLLLAVFDDDKRAAREEAKKALAPFKGA